LLLSYFQLLFFFLFPFSPPATQSPIVAFDELKDFFFFFFFTIDRETLLTETKRARGFLCSGHCVIFRERLQKRDKLEFGLGLVSDGIPLQRAYNQDLAFGLLTTYLVPTVLLGMNLMC
jgi:hypothetical protein